MLDSNKIIDQVKTLLETKQSKDYLLLKICELLKKEVSHYDWVGFYEPNKTNQLLTLGPYVGKPTDHINIPIGKGVCGQVAENLETMIVQDVSQMKNYIACSIDVQSEIVVPILIEGQFVAEIDIDSHSHAPFTSKDQELLENLAGLIKVLF